MHNAEFALRSSIEFTHFPGKLLPCEIFSAHSALVNGRAVPATRQLAGTSACPLPPRCPLLNSWSKVGRVI